MTRLADSRDPLGLGILILQHSGYDNKQFSLDLRGGLLACRVKDRNDREADGLGAWTYDRDSVGDLNGGFLWPETTRPIPGWAFAWPTMLKGGTQGTPTQSGGGGMSSGPGAPPPQFQNVETPSNQANTPPQGPGTFGIGPAAPPQQGMTQTGQMGLQVKSVDNHACGLMTSVNMIPVRDDIMRDDARFKEITPKWPKTNVPRGRIWPKMARGTYGVGLTATNEERQIEYFYPTEPRRVAVNKAGDPAIGSLTCDLTETHEYDPTRTSRLQSHEWVIKEPMG